MNLVVESSQEYQFLESSQGLGGVRGVSSDIFDLGLDRVQEGHDEGEDVEDAVDADGEDVQMETGLHEETGRDGQDIPVRDRDGGDEEDRDVEVNHVGHGVQSGHAEREEGEVR